MKKKIIDTLYDMRSAIITMRLYTLYTIRLYTKASSTTDDISLCMKNLFF
jgi:hypothetical protein